jgi:hypothetical protein
LNSGIVTEYRTRLLGIRALAQTLRIPAFPFKYNAAPATWGQVARCTVYDAIWYALSEHSTIASLAAIDFPSGYTDFQYNPGIQIPEGAILDSVDTLAFFASGAMVNHSPNGELYIRQSLLYATSGRGSAVVYATYTSEDGLAQRILHPPVNRFPLSAIRAGYATFNTTTNTPRVYNSLAPAESTPTALQETLDGIIMAKNLSDTNANTEAGKLTINHFFASVEAAGVSAELIAGYSTVNPSCFQWHKFDIGIGETLDGTSLGSGTRFLCTQVNSTFNKDEWGIVNSAEFREETDGGSNYARETDFVPLGTNANYPTYPPGSYSVYLDDFDMPSDTYGADYDSQRQGWEDPTVDPETAAENANDQPGVSETLYIPYQGGVVSTSAATTLGASYLLRVTGSGYIAETTAAGEWCHRFDFRESNGNWTPYSESGQSALGTWVEDSGWEDSDGTTFGHVYRGVSIQYTGMASGDKNFTQVIVEYSYTYGHFDLDFIAEADVEFFNVYPSASGDIISLLVGERGAFDGNFKTYIETHPSSTWFFTNNTLNLFMMSANDNIIPKTTDGSVTIHSVEIHGTGVNPFSTDGTACGDPVYADALYYSLDDWDTTTKHPNGSFLYLDANAIANSLEFNASHVYELTVTGTGDLFDFSFTDGYNSNYSDNQANAFLRVEIIPL